MIKPLNKPTKTEDWREKYPLNTYYSESKRELVEFIENLISKAISKNEIGVLYITKNGKRRRMTMEDVDDLVQGGKKQERNRILNLPSMKEDTLNSEPFYPYEQRFGRNQLRLEIKKEINK